MSREPDFITYGDACLEAAWDFSKDLKFWWHIEWPHSIKSLTLKNLRVVRQCKISNKLVSINLLEFLTEIISYAAVTVRFLQDETLCDQPYPFHLNWTDNKTSKAWIRKAATRTPKGKALQRILCSLMINNPVGIKADFIPGVNNVLADAISRTYSNSTSPPSFINLFKEFPEMKSWERFHPSQELLSLLFSALLDYLEPGLCHPKTLGHFSAANSTS